MLFRSFTLKELAPYFDLPINEAAEQLGVCATVLKKLCRNNGVDRWPYRKIKSINGMIESLQQLIDANDGDIPAMNMDMEDLLAKKQYLLENPNASYKSVVSKYAINSFNAKIQKAQAEIPSCSASDAPKTHDIPGPSKTITKTTPKPRITSAVAIKPVKFEMPRIEDMESVEGAARALASLSSIKKDPQPENKPQNHTTAPETSKTEAKQLPVRLDTSNAFHFLKNFNYSRVPLTSCQESIIKPNILNPLRMSG